MFEIKIFGKDKDKSIFWHLICFEKENKLICVGLFDYGPQKSFKTAFKTILSVHK